MCGTLVCLFQDAVILSCFIHNKKKSCYVWTEVNTYIIFPVICVFMCMACIKKFVSLSEAVYVLMLYLKGLCLLPWLVSLVLSNFAWLCCFHVFKGEQIFIPTLCGYLASVTDGYWHVVFNSLYIAEKENLCLYGFPNELWEVNLPAEEVPPELPEPALGINFARDGMQEKDWLSLVAVHSDAWLLAVAFYFGARFGFDKADRYIFL